MSVATEQAFVATAYKNILFRSAANIASTATQADIDNLAAMISDGRMTEAQAATTLAASAEAAGTVLPIVALYEGLLKRAPETGALAFYLADLNSGDSLNSITQDFLHSGEFAGLYGAQPTPTALVGALYQNVLGRAASAAETAFYVDFLGGINAVPTPAAMASVVQYFIQSPEALGDNSANVRAWLVAGVNGTYPATIGTPAALGPVLTIPGTGGVAITATATSADTGGVTVGNSAGLSEPTGAITITDNAATGPVVIYGGAGVTVTTFSTGGVTIGAGTLATDPSGAITVTDNAASGAVVTYGGAGVTVTTASISGVTVGTAGGTAEPSGAVSITDTAASGALSVFGGAAVVITSSSATPIIIGISGLAAADPTGNITITNHAINTNAGFGTANATIFANGGNSVTITGTSGDTITDVSAAALLANATLDGVGGTTTIHTGNALISLTVLDGASSSNQTVIGQAGHALALAVGSTTSIAAFANIVDATAGIVTVSATGSTVETLTLSAVTATSIILGAHTGTDSLVVGTVGAGASGATVTISGAVVGDSIRFADSTTSLISAGAVTGTLAAAVASVDALASTIAHSATVFQNGGLTYVLESVAAGTGILHGGDSLIELVGVHTLSAPVSGLLTLLS